MSLRPRVVVCLDVDGGRVVKGTKFKGLRDVGDPVELARRYEEEGADEVVYLDISASHEGRGTLLDLVRRTAETLFIPLTVGGGVRTVDDMGALLRAGADKVSVNSAAVKRPEVLSEGAERFGAQCVVISIDAKRARSRAEPSHGTGSPHTVSDGADSGDGDDRASPDFEWEAYIHGGRRPTGMDAVDWARRAVDRGAGEVLLTSIDRDGVRTGYDLELTGAVSRAVSVPVIASGGAGEASHLRDAFVQGGAQAALLAGILHDGVTTVGALKRKLSGWGVEVREVGGARG